MTGLLFAVLVAAAPLDSATTAYQAGSLDEARQQLVSLLYPLRLANEETERDARLLLAATYFASDDAARAEEELVLALGVFGEARPDPLLYPPDFIAFVNAVRERQAQRIRLLATERAGKRVVPAAPREVPSALWSFVPFGTGQFKNGQPVKGTVLAVSQGACAVVAVASAVAALGLKGPDGLYSREDASTARALNVSYLAGAYTCAALYLYGLVDGLVVRALAD